MDVATLHAWVLEDFGRTLSFVEQVHHGADDGASLWRAATPDGEELAVKWTSGGSLAGLTLPTALAAQGVSGLPSVRPTTDGRPCAERGGRRLVVQPWLPHRRAISGSPRPAHWSALGALLGQVHALTSGAPVADVPPDPHDPEALVARVRALDRRLQVSGGGAADGVAAAASGAWRTASADLLVLADAATALAPRVRADPSPQVVCHADPHLGNVLLQGDRWVWLLDWDDAVVAHPEQDLMFVADGGVLAGLPVDDAEHTAFDAGYRAHHPQAVPPDPGRLAYYQAVRGLVDAVDWTERACGRATGPGGRADALEVVRGVLSPTGLVQAAVRNVRALA